MKLKKILFVKIVLLVLAILIIIVVIDARKLSGLAIKQQSSVEYKAVLHDKNYIVKYRPKEVLEPFFGKAMIEFGTRFALVRDDLPKLAKKFVMYHEIYHLQDQEHTNIIAREIHANLGALPYAPIGFIQTVFLTLTNPERLSYYFSLVF